MAEAEYFLIVPKNGNQDGSFLDVLVEFVHEEAGRLIVRFASNDSTWKKGEIYILNAARWGLEKASDTMVALLQN